MDRDNLVFWGHQVADVLALAVILLTKDSLEVEGMALRAVGFGVLAVGVLVVAYSLMHLRAKEQGRIEPVIARLVTDGPYRFVRHPYYLGWTIGFVGLALGLMSLWGLLATLLISVPAAINHARLEDQALERRFGEEWRSYAETSSFMFLPLY